MGLIQTNGTQSPSSFLTNVLSRPVSDCKFGRGRFSAPSDGLILNRIGEAADFFDFNRDRITIL